jgi:Tfp pilus assembly protein PilN
VRAINLLPRDGDQFGRQQTSWVVLGPVIGVVLIASILSVLFLSASGKVKDRKAELATLKAELAAIPTPSLAKRQLESTLAADKQVRVAALNGALSRRVAWDRVFREFSLVLPDDVWLKSVSAKAPVSSSSSTPVTPATGNVAATGFLLDGYTYSHAAVARLLARLAVVPDLANVQLQSSTLTQGATSRIVHFQIAADVRYPGGGS